MTPTPHTGWLRVCPRGRWHPVCHGQTWDECMARLLRVEREGAYQDLTVLPTGQHPTRETSK